MEMYLTFRRCNQHLLESSWFPPWRSLLLPPFFIWLHPPIPPPRLPSIHFFLPRPLACPPLLPPPSSLLVFSHLRRLSLQKRGSDLLSPFCCYPSLSGPPAWSRYHGQSCKTANRRTDAALVGVSRLGWDHNRIYMVMKSDKLRRACLGHIPVRSCWGLEHLHADFSGGGRAECDGASSHRRVYFSFHV